MSIVVEALERLQQRQQLIAAMPTPAMWSGNLGTKPRKPWPWRTLAVLLCVVAVGMDSARSWYDSPRTSATFAAATKVKAVATEAKQEPVVEPAVEKHATPISDHDPFPWIGSIHRSEIPLEQKFQRWREQVENLADQHRIQVGLVTVGPRHLREHLARLNEIQKQDIFVVQALFRQRKAYYILATTPQGAPASVADKLENFLSIKPFRTTAGKLKKRMHALDSHEDKKISDPPQATSIRQEENIEPSAAQLWRSLGKARQLIASGRPADAITELQPYMEMEEQWEPPLWSATAYTALGELQRAREILEQAQERFPARAELWIQRAVLAQEEGNYAHALTLLGRAAELDSSLAEISLNVGFCFDMLQMKAQALEAYQRYLAQSIDQPHLAASRSQVLQRVSELSQRL